MPKKTAPAIFAAALLAVISLPTWLAAEEKGKAVYNSWSEIAQAMTVPLNKACEVYAAGGSKEEARDLVNEAYFGFYEKEGFERYVRSMVSGKRAAKVEFQFATIKTSIKNGEPKEEVRSETDDLIAWLLEDGAILDEKFGITAEPAAAPEGGAAAPAGGAQPAAAAGPGGLEAPSGAHGVTDFISALGILLREGFEAILVIAAIAAYLKRSENGRLIRTVYISAIAAVLASFIAAYLFQRLFASSIAGGQNQEILEGATMLLATVVLFGVSGWMFSKAEAEAWKRYIEGKVRAAVTAGSSFALAAAAFLAVFREGAETILFYQTLLIQPGADHTMIWTGFLVGCVGLAVIFMVIRMGTMRLPLRPFFIGTSILMFIMSVAFAGGGMKEFIEGDLFGATPITAVPIPTVDILGIFPYVQTIVPQLALVALAVFSVIWITARSKSKSLGAGGAAAA